MSTIRALADMPRAEFEVRLEPIWNEAVDFVNKRDYISKDPVMLFTDDILKESMAYIDTINKSGVNPKTCEPVTGWVFNSLAIFHVWEFPWELVKKYTSIYYNATFFAHPERILDHEIVREGPIADYALQSLITGLGDDVIKVRRGYGGDLTSIMGPFISYFALGLMCGESANLSMQYVENHAVRLRYLDKPKNKHPTHHMPGAKQ
jgi:hypothetical protein